VTSCQATYYQTPGALIPSITCTGEFITPSESVRDDASEGISVDVSLAVSYLLDEVDELDVPTSTYPDTSDIVGTNTCAERSGSAFHAFYTTFHPRFYDGAKEFYDDFHTSLWKGNLGKAWHDSRFVVSPCAKHGADWSDLIYVTADGAPRHFDGENGQIFTTDSEVTDLTQLGTGDAEYMLNAACSTASAMYCDGRTAVSRYTEQTDYHSVFHGLHIYSGHHGTSINSTSDRHKDRARTLSEYLKDGLTIIEAWEDTADDVSIWNNDASRVCGEMIDPDNSCDFTSPWNDCSRWSCYASSFYQDGKQYETLLNRDLWPYNVDVDPDDPDYDIDLRYEYQSETVPIYAPGHSLP
jgi:hypothetical protein